MHIRLIATDLDGTLFGADHRPAPPAVAAINAAVDAGITVIAATGRSWFRGADQATSTGAQLHHFIGSNGGHRMNLMTRRMEERLTIDAAIIQQMTATLLRELGPIGFGYELQDGMAWDERFVQLSPVNIYGEAREARPTPFDRLVSAGKLFVIHPDVAGVDLVELVSSLVPSEVNVTTSGAPFVELTPPGADKGSAVARLAEELGIAAEETLAFGDNQNDLTLIEWAGHGVAMGNALELVKDIADEVAASNVDHGVAQVIERLLQS